MNKDRGFEDRTYFRTKDGLKVSRNVCNFI